MRQRCAGVGRPSWTGKFRPNYKSLKRPVDFERSGGGLEGQIRTNAGIIRLNCRLCVPLSLSIRPPTSVQTEGRPRTNCKYDRIAG